MPDRKPSRRKSALTGPLGGSLLTFDSESPLMSSDDKDSGEILSVKAALAGMGYDLGDEAESSDSGEKTQRAIKAFQREHGLEPTGRIDEETAALLKRKPTASTMYGGR